MIRNPFILKKKKYTFNDEPFEFTNKNVRTHFKKIYVFCKFNNNIDYQKILESEIDYDDFKDIIKMFTLYESNISLIYNKILNPNLIIIDTEIIKESNYFGYNLPDKILVLPIFNISFLHIQNHIDNITENINTFDKLYNELVINNLHIKNNLENFSFREISNIFKLVKNLEIDEYWTKMSNCNININKEFQIRCFNYTPIQNKKSDNISSVDIIEINKSVDYFDNMLDKKQNNLDNNFNNRYYYSRNLSKYTNNEIYSIFNFLEDKLNYYRENIDVFNNNESKIKKISILINVLYNKLFRRFLSLYFK